MLSLRSLVMWPAPRRRAQEKDQRFGGTCQLVRAGSAPVAAILSPVSSRQARRAAVVVLLSLIAGAAVLAHGPLALGALRVAGVSLLWWYAALAAPVMAVVVVIAALLVREP